MYEVYILKNNDWVLFTSCEDIKQLDKILWKLTNLRPDKPIQVLQEGNVMCLLNGTIEQYLYFKNRYVRGNKEDYIKFVYKYKHRSE